jgi:hypothetical protein
MTVVIGIVRDISGRRPTHEKNTDINTKGASDQIIEDKA